MRPLELTVEGFRSYRHRATFDWRGRRLVGIVGPIGSGKSSLLDAMTFALYGKTPTYEAATRSLIHQQLDQGHVELRFSVDGQVWRVARGLRRKGQSGHQLQLLPSDEPDVEPLETVSGETPVTARVTALLGMDFKTFCRSVLLAQNRFAEFLDARPGERDQVLKGVFGLERIDRAHEVAKTRLASARAELDVVANEMARIEDARERLPEAEAEEKDAGERVARLTAVAPEVDRLGDATESARNAAAAAIARIEEVEELTRELPSLEDIDRVSGQGEEAELAVRDATTEAKDAEDRRLAAEADAADAEKKAGGRERLEEAAALIQRRDHEIITAEGCRFRSESADHELRTAEKSAEAAEAVAVKAEAAANDADEAARVAHEAVAEAEVLLEEARHTDMAAELRGSLAKGEPCPVCAQTVATLPPKGARAAKAVAATKALERARAAEDKRRTAAEKARADVAGATERTAAARRALEAARRAQKSVAIELAAADRAVAKTERGLTGLLGKGDPVEELSLRRKAVAAARDAVKDAEENARAAAAARDAARERADRLRDELADVAVRLSGAWGRLGESRSVERTPDALRTAYRDVGEKLLAAHEGAVAARDAAAASEAEASAALQALYRDADVTPGRPFAQAVTEAATAHGAAKTRVEELRRVLSGQRSLAERVKKIERRRDLAERLSDDLRPSAFLRFLLEEERAELAALGSEHFQDLTGGSYRFSDDGAFAVLDMNAGATERRADSLSGGETFLASLALALALAEMVARGGGRMDAFFLDEGFGSLDPDHLDKAMEGIERLVAESEHRLVVVVSHVAAMRDAIDDLVVLDKDPTTGDTIVRAGAQFGESI
jgi:DNA repair protein SbcC/Rad50